MATPIVFNGVSYSIPAYGDVGYAQGPGNLSSYLIALASGVLQASGGLLSLTSQANFGPNFGLTAVNFTSTTTNPATVGSVRLASTDTIDWRNTANTLNLPLGINGSDQLTFNGVVIDTVAVGGVVSAGVAGRLTLYPASSNVVDDVYVQNAQNIDILIAAQAARSTALEYTIPNPGNAVATATFALLELAQTFTATQTISAATNQLILGSTNTITLTAPAPAASRVYTIPDVLGAASFVMTAGVQSIAGAKTFTDPITQDDTTNQLILGTTRTITINAPTPATSSRVYTIPDQGANSNFLVSQLSPAVTVNAAGYVIGSVVQSVQAVQTASVTTTSNTYVTTNLTANITPKATTHKILVTFSGAIQNTVGSSGFATIFRNAVDLDATGNGFASVGSGTLTLFSDLGVSFLDSPASISSITYNIRFRSNASATITWNPNSMSSVILLTEIAN